MEKPFITEAEFLELGRTEISTAKALAEALHVFQPQVILTDEGAKKLYRNIQLSLFATRIKDAEKGKKREDDETIAGWLDKGFPTFRYGHAGNFLVPDPKDDFSWNRPWDDIEHPSEEDRAQLHREYETLCNEGALSTPVMLIQINWSGIGWNNNAPFWYNILNHGGVDGEKDGVKCMAGRLPKIWHTIVDNGYEDTFRGAYVTDFYKPFSTPKSGTFEETFKGATLGAYLHDDDAAKAKWNTNLDNSDYADLRRFATLESGDDFTGNIDPQLNLLTLLYMAMFVQLCEEAKMLHIEHPIMVPWGRIPQSGLETSTAKAEGSETFPLPAELPFLDGKSVEVAFADTFMQHNSNGNGHMGGWLETEALSTFSTIRDMKADWKAEYGDKA